MSYLKSVLAECWSPDPSEMAGNVLAVLISTGALPRCEYERMEQDFKVYELSKSMTILEIAQRMHLAKSSVYKMFHRHRQRVRHKTVKVA